MRVAAAMSIVAAAGWLWVASANHGCSDNQLPTATLNRDNIVVPDNESQQMNEFAKIAVTFVLGFCTAVLAEPLRRWLFKSAVSLSFEPKIGFGRGHVSLTTTNIHGVMAKYVRVLAQCSSHFGITAQRCKPFLTNIARLDPRTGEYQDLHHDPIPLNWSYIGDRELNIDPTMKFYFDVVEVYSDKNYLRPQTTIDPATFGDILKEHGRYRFLVVLSGENIRPVPETIEFEWKGSFDSLTENCF